MTAALVVSIILNIALLVSLVLITLLFSTALKDHIQLTDRVHTRSDRHINGLLDRIMAADWVTFRAAQSEDLAEEGGQIFPTPDMDEDGEFLMTQLSEDELRRMAHERTLLTEDFPEERE